MSRLKWRSDFALTSARPSFPSRTAEWHSSDLWRQTHDPQELSRASRFDNDAGRRWTSPRWRARRRSSYAQAREQFFPLLVYRTGAYGPNGKPWADGKLDYLKMINARDGGINGVKLTYEECEYGYATDRGVECYERLEDPARAWRCSSRSRPASPSR